MLNRKDKEELEIAHFVFHILLKDDEEPTYLDQVILTTQQKNFFSKWLSESISLGVEFEFRDKSKEGGIYSICKGIRTEDEFIEASKVISSEFKRFHKGSSSDGLLVIALVKLTDGFALFLVKMNYSETLQYELQERNGKMVAILTEVTNPINESKQAIQKSAIINIDAGYDWDVFAQDKQNPHKYKIADYFQAFLDVREREVSSVLTREVFHAVTKWAKKNRNELDPEQNYTNYKGRATDYLNSHDDFDTEEYVRSVISDANEERRLKLQKSFIDYLDEHDLSGRAFQIRRNSIPRRETKITWKTHNDVEIIFEGSAESNNIEKTNVNGEFIITIKTSNIQEI